MVCECCWELFRIEVSAPHCMEWDEWLCSEHAGQAMEDEPPSPQESGVSKEET